MKFKVFLAEPSLAQGIAPLLAKAEAFINDNSYQATSMGLEYVEERNVVCLSLGYLIGDIMPLPKRIKLTAFDLGQPQGEDHVAELFEQTVGDRDFLCHEFMIDKTGNFTLVLLERL